MIPFLIGEVLAVDLPGRGSRPGDRSVFTQVDFVESVVEDIVSDDLEDVVLVGHSLAGITLPGVAARLTARVRHVVFVSCSVPESGTSVAEILGDLSPVTAEVVARLGDGVVASDGTLHPELARAMFCNDMGDEMFAYTTALMVPECNKVITEPLAMPELPDDLLCTYVRLLKDQSLALATQDVMAARLGPSELVNVVDLDAGHMAMISEPEALAAVLNPLGNPAA
jgi:pimeloyl-ACP methyl ester carboxylesterase